MSEMINFGIDLGTTNSLVAKFNKGSVEVFKDPLRQGTEVLPSVVGFRNDRILVGDKARTHLETDPRNVASQFKRTMGTTESYKIKSLGQSKTPIELSAFVLKELKTFIHTGEVPEAVVITIPASFEMVQANATEEAGYAAGFKQVVLLSEPIAASLAYANTEKNVDLKTSKWIVYDLGGGTFDVALVNIVEGELKIADHEGNNYLGGADFDALIVEKLIVPQLEKQGKFTDLPAQMKGATGRYNRLWYSLLSLAEEAKIELSTRGSSEIDLSRRSVIDENGKAIDDGIQITRSEYESLIKDAIDGTAKMLEKILTRNSLRPQDLKFVLMVGGSTLTPFVRKRIEELLGIPVNTGINPTNAIAIGAAYFAATKEINLGERQAEKTVQPGALGVKVAYNRTSQEREEMFSAKVEGNIAGLLYRITREDGGYDSGLKKLASRITEDLPLQEDAYNRFAFKILDGHNNPIPADIDSIQITQGKYSVVGQVLPLALSLVRDDLNAGGTWLDCIFAKNSIIPAATKRPVEVNATVAHGSDDAVRIIVVEGPPENHFTENRKQGELIITGKQLKQDLHRGTEIDLTFELSESQLLTVEAYIHPSGPTFSKVFHREYRDVDVEGLAQEVRILGARLDHEIAEASASGNDDVVDRIEKLRDRNGKLYDEVALSFFDDVTVAKFPLDNRKREIAQELGQLMGGKRIERLRAEYQTVKDEVTGIVNEGGNDGDRRRLHELVTREHTFLNSKNPKKLEAAIEELRSVASPILRRTPDFLVSVFQDLIGRREVFNDQLQAENLLEAGKKCIAAEDWEKLDGVIGHLYDLLPEKMASMEKDANRGYYTRI